MIKRLLAAVILTVFPVSLAACGGSDSNSSARVADTKVTYLTSFGTFGRDAYAFVAKDKGFFQKAGLDVDIQPGSGSVDVMKLVASGKAQFGAADFSALAVTQANEKLPVTAVAAVQQRSLAAIMSLDGDGITTPASLEGKTIGDMPGSTVGVMFPAYAKAAGIDPAKVKFVPGNPQALPQLLAAGRVDAIGQFVVGKGLVASVSRGKDVVVLPYGDVLPDLYGIVLVTSDKLSANSADEVKRFRDALLEGLRYSIDHPDEAAAILKKHVATTDTEVAAAEIREMAPYVVSSGQTLGALDESRVGQVIDMMGAALKNKIAPADLVDFGLATRE